MRRLLVPFGVLAEECDISFARFHHNAHKRRSWLVRNVWREELGILREYADWGCDVDHAAADEALEIPYVVEVGRDANDMRQLIGVVA
jgi:hypothetical protein